MASAQPDSTVAARPSHSRLVTLLVVVTALGVVLAAVGGFLLTREAASGAESGDRKEVTTRANDFAVAYNTYDVANLADYQDRLKGLLTPAYNKDFVKVTDAVFEALETKKQKSGSAHVLGVAVDSIDQDSAQTLVAVDAKISNTDNKAAVLRHFRWRISFTKTKGEWLVSGFESVAPVDAESAPAPTTTPSPEATSGGDSK